MTSIAQNGKPAYKPTIRLVDIHQGLYQVSSSDGTRFYAVDVKHITCTCEAGRRGFAGCRHVPYCKHVAVAKYWARCLHDTRYPAAA